MKKVLKWLDDYLEESLGVILMSLMALVIFVQVVFRYVFNNSLSWSEELARYMFIWVIYLGISYGCKNMKHIKVDALLRVFPKKVRPHIETIGTIIFLIFAIYITVTGTDLALKQIPLNRKSPAIGIPMQYIYFAAPVGMGLSSIRLIQNLIYKFKDKRSD